MVHHARIPGKSLFFLPHGYIWIPRSINYVSTYQPVVLSYFVIQFYSFWHIECEYIFHRMIVAMNREWLPCVAKINRWIKSNALRGNIFECFGSQSSTATASSTTYDCQLACRIGERYLNHLSFAGNSISARNIRPSQNKTLIFFHLYAYSMLLNSVPANSAPTERTTRLPNCVLECLMPKRVKLNYYFDCKMVRFRVSTNKSKEQRLAPG